MNAHLVATLELIKTGHWLTDSVSRELKEFNISEPQYNVLRVLQDNKRNPISVNTILENMLQKSSNVTRIVDKLELKGLVERTISPSDRRKMDIVITDEGSKLLLTLDKKVDSFHEPMIKFITEEELKTLIMLIRKYKGEITK